MKTKILLPLSFFSLCLSTGCNAISIKRINLETVDRNKCCSVYDKIQAAQKDESENYKLFNKGTITYKRKGEANGNFRQDEVSYHNLNFSMSSGYIISWSLEDRYFNLVGENDNVHIIGNKDGEYWHFSKNITNGKEYKFKYNCTHKVKEFTSFTNFLIDKIDYYTVFFIPFIYSICGGITGENSYAESSLIPLTEDSVVPNDLFTDDLYIEAVRLNEFYKDNRDGYSTSISYGSNDDSSLSATLKGKIKNMDLSKTRFEQGYTEFDNFVCFQDNFIKQVEYKVKGQVINTRKVNLNLKYDIHVSEEVEKDKCTVETLNPDEYELGDE